MRKAIGQLHIGLRKPRYCDLHIKCFMSGGEKHPCFGSSSVCLTKSVSLFLQDEKARKALTDLSASLGYVDSFLLLAFCKFLHKPALVSLHQAPPKFIGAPVLK